MDGFDPLFDDEPPVQSSFSLSLPTFDDPPPVVTVREPVTGDSDFLFFEQNVGTIALDGSHRSERPSVFSPTAPLASSSTDSAPRSKVSRRPANSSQKKKKATRAQRTGQAINQPYRPSSLRESVLVQLARDPNVIPLLQSIVEYVYRTNLVPAQPTSTPSSHSKTQSSRPIKRRRLFKVPAGAEDWTVPFPFKEGEGPQYYQETWEMKRLIVLLSSLMRNLRDWRRKHGTVSVNPQAPERVLRNRRQTSEQTQDSEAEPSSADADSPPAFNLGLEVPNPSNLDGTLQSLVELFSSYEQTDDSFLNVDLRALGSGTDLSQILFTTDNADPSNTWWGHLPPFSSGFDAPEHLEETPSFPPYTPHQSQEPDPDMMNTDQTALFGGMDPSSLSRDPTAFDFISSPQTKPQDVNMFADNSMADQDALIPILNHSAESLPCDEMAGILSESSYSVPSTSAPSMTVSPSLSALTELPPHHSINQTEVVLAPPVATGRGIATLSKRGRARSTAVLRRDLNKQLHGGRNGRGRVKNDADTSSVPTPSPDIDSAQTPSTTKGRKVRASQTTIRSREELLERARQWRDLMAKELEDARVARWETMMEGLVLHEIGLDVRKPDSGQ